MTGTRSVGVGLILLVSFCECGAQWSLTPAEKGFHTDLDAGLRFGPMDGYLQTPAGGKPGSTSNKRPTFRELGIDTVATADVSLHSRWAAHTVYAGASLTPLSDQGVLHKQLISNGTTFPADTSVNSDVHLDCYRVGYEYRFLFANPQGASISFAPAIGLALLDFSYRLTGGHGLSADRSYMSGAAQLGFETEWNPGGRFSLGADCFGTVPEPKDIVIFTAEITGRCRLWGTANRGGTAFLGVGYDRIETQDTQRVSNHVLANMGPLLVAGLKVGF